MYEPCLPAHLNSKISTHVSHLNHQLFSVWKRVEEDFLMRVTISQQEPSRGDSHGNATELTHETK